MAPGENKGIRMGKTIRDGWNKVLLGDLIEISHGFPFSGEFFSLEPTHRLIITPGNVKRGGGFNDARLKYYKNMEPDPADIPGLTGSRFMLEPDDIVIALTDLSREGNILGVSARLPDVGDRTILQNQRIGKVRVTSKDLSPHFLYWLLRTHFYRKHVIGAASGTTVRHTTPGVIRSYRFFLPPIDKQEAIADFLDILESRVGLLEQSNEKEERWIVSYCGRKFKRVRRTAPLSDFGRIVCGKTPSKAIRHYFGGSIPFIKIPDMRNRVYVTDTEDTLTAEGAAVQLSKQVPAHSVCVSCVATIGLVTLTARPSFTNQQINTIIPRDLRGGYYLYCALKQDKITRTLRKEAGGGTTIPNLNTRRFSEIAIPYPPRHDLDMFYDVAHGSFERILLNTRRIEKLNAYRDSLLPRLMSGSQSPTAREVPT